MTGRNDGKYGSDGKIIPATRHSPQRLLPPRGDYQTLLSFQKAEVVYDITFRFAAFVETRPATVVANIAICLIHQANYLIDHQLRRLETDFLHQGGLRERMTRARLEYRKSKPDVP